VCVCVCVRVCVHVYVYNVFGMMQDCNPPIAPSGGTYVGEAVAKRLNYFRLGGLGVGGWGLGVGGWGLGLGFWVLGFGFWVLGFGFDA